MEKKYDQRSGDLEALDDLRLICSKKRKVLLYSELENVYCGEDSPEDSVSPAASATYGCCEREELTDVEKSFGSPDLENVVDLKSDGLETEISTSISGVLIRPSTPTNEHCRDSNQALMNSTTPKKKSTASSRRNIPSPAEKMPPATEIEEFFAAAEKSEQKRFAEKYNYDILKDVPLEGKYQWVRLQP